MEYTFLAAAQNVDDGVWLQETLAPLGQVLKSSDHMEELLGLIEVTGASLVFVGIDREHMVSQCALVEGLLEARPMLAVVGIGDGFDNQLVISAMRAGARDFISYGLRSSEVLGLVRRLIQRLPQLPAHREQGGLTLLYGVQPDAGAALVASQLALGLQTRGQDVLLVDLGMPGGESLDLLGVESTFSFGDALRNLRRLDSDLIDSAFCRHPGGLRVLPLGSGDEPLAASTSAELYLLLGALRQSFAHVVLNLCGQPDSDALRTCINNAQRLYWYVDQGVSTCRRNLDQLQAWQGKGIKLEGAALLVDRYIPGVAPDAMTLAHTFELPLAASLPGSASLRLRVLNQGRPLSRLAPRDALTRAIERLVEQGAGTPVRRWLPYLLGRFA
ncbi:pilus assembly protein [Stutzerimonas stutzeri]|uniref:Pilus assembly protein n=1 Tax=Stutzerimonas stutzeri TaxID=316 RepID=A0A2N8STJ6_STUST|nr:pilus assembly protein [Stutzerimonas stutzeri]MCQ4325819.1 pilus assembly protein [Stutzerimonas stutzeri]PNG05818.1 pilus assembly protein [Stutzerimonas stutzeri]